MLLLDVLQKNKVSARPPFWFMRQAGRYLPEYQEVRQKAGGFWPLCFTPTLACEVTLQPLQRFDMDAAILFSDILVIPKALGQNVTFDQHHGPLLSPVHWLQEAKHLSQKIHWETLAPVFETVTLVRNRLPADKALIGFSGAPWTLATYMLGAGKHNRPDTVKQILSPHHRPHLEAFLLELGDVVLQYLEKQIESGADVIQLFDTWAGVLSFEDQKSLILPSLQNIIHSLKQKFPNTPIIYFAKGSLDLGVLLQEKIPSLALGVDHHTPVAWISKNLKNKSIWQGNLSPEVLLEGGAELEKAVDQILTTFSHTPYIFNLGHGVLPSTPIENVAFVAQKIREYA